MAPVSKTYAQSGNSTAQGEAMNRLRRTRALEHLMLDILMLALGLGFFAAAVGYTYACERL